MMCAFARLSRSSMNRRSSAIRASRSFSSSRDSFSMRSDWLLTNCSSPAPVDEVAVGVAAVAAAPVEAAAADPRPARCAAARTARRTRPDSPQSAARPQGAAGWRDARPPSPAHEHGGRRGKASAKCGGFGESRGARPGLPCGAPPRNHPPSENERRRDSFAEQRRNAEGESVLHFREAERRSGRKGEVFPREREHLRRKSRSDEAQANIKNPRK